MKRESIYQLLYSVRQGDVTPEAALEKLSFLPYEDLGFAKVDHHRALRRNFPEVIFGSGKTGEQILAIARAMADHGSPVLVTRVSDEAAFLLQEAFPAGRHFPQARIFFSGPLPAASSAAPSGPAPASASLPASDPLAASAQSPPPGPLPADKRPGKVVVATGGTADLPVAEEAAVTLEILGNEVIRLYDVGVAGVHRLLSHLEVLRSARVIVAVAGMDGALPSVISGLVAVPVVAVPTSVGYGASFGGLAALLTMLNSCSTGVGVVNIDNGFGAAVLADLINRC